MENDKENEMKTSRRPMQNSLMFLALLALCGTAFAQVPQPRPVEKVKKPAALSQSAQAVPVNPDLARLSGKIEAYSTSDNVKNAACSSIEVTIKRCTNCFQANQAQETLATIKATGGTIATGCTYAKMLPKGQGVVVSAVLPLNLLVPPPPPPPAGPMALSGWNGPFDFQTNMSKDVKMNFYFR